MFRKLCIVVPLLVAISGCDAVLDLVPGLRVEPDPRRPVGDTGEVALKRFESEQEFARYFGDQVTADRRFGFAMDELAVTDGMDATPLGAPNGGAAPSAPDAVAGDGGRGDSDPGQFSTTTTQEEGVQEADVIKNDGTYLYVLSDAVLRVVQADPGEGLRELSSVELDGFGENLYLLGDKLVALTRPDMSFDGPVPVGAQEIIGPPVFYRPRLQVTVVDMTDRENPRVDSTTSFEGNLVSSRMTGNDLHLVMVSYPDFFAPVIELRGGEPVMADVSVDEILPDFEVRVADQDTAVGNTVEVTDVYRPADPDGYGLATVITLDVAAPEAFRAIGVLAYPGNIYASTQALYLTDASFDFFGDTRPSTDVYKFAFTDEGPVLTGVGSVPGRILDQYSMSEFEGHLRVATTVDGRGGFAGEIAPSTNNVYVLGQGTDGLDVVGRVEDIAPGERIFSARFMGPRGYLVTFEEIDPLFTLDLSDPTSPVVVGDLKVPGFSTFIMAMDENHLLTVGQDALIDGPFVVPQGVQLSIFDVSDFSNPRLAFQERIGEPDAWSEALHNPKALTYFGAENLLALPIEVNYFVGGIDFVEDGGAVDGSGVTVDPGQPGDVPVAPAAAGEVLPPPEPFRGLMVYRVRADAGFELLGRMSSTMDDGTFYTRFTRGVFINANVFSVTNRGVVGAPITAVDSTPWQIAFPAAESAVPFDGGMIDVPTSP